MATVVPSSWMPDAQMKRIHVHWTAGGHRANSTDKNAYHILIEGDGKLVRGNKSIAANAPGSGMTPAHHTLNANTGAIGVSLCAMANAVERPFHAGQFPITRVQWDTAIGVIAQLAHRYNIPVTRRTILTHAEVQPTLGITQRNKWDITRLCFTDDFIGHQAVGDEMRGRVAVELDKLRPSSPGALPDEMRLPRLRVHGVAPSTLNFRVSPGGAKVGELPEGTLVERIALFQDWSQVRTPGGFVGWVATDYLRPVGAS